MKFALWVADFPSEPVYAAISMLRRRLRVDEVTIVCNAAKYLPTVIVVGILLQLLVDEYLRQMELRGLIRRRTVERPGANPADEDQPSAEDQT